MACYIISGALSFILFISGLITFFNYNDNLKLKEYDCKLTNVTYPTKLPSINNTDMKNFVKCDCGRYCVSNLGTCLNIYGTINNNKILSFKKSISSKAYECTFTEKKCINGEDITDRINKIKEVTKLGEYYKNIIKNNETIKCYYNNNNEYIYLEKNVNYIIFTILFSVSFIIIIIMLCCYLNRKSKNKNINKNINKN
jgi:hypothetical protein